MITSNLIPILQTAIGPMILISAIGLLLLTMTNRLGRAIDRARALAGHPAEAGSPLEGQLSILHHRARLLRSAILAASGSALCGALLVLTLFASALLGVLLGWLLVALFVGAMLSLIVSLALFIRDVNLSLRALELQLTRRPGGTAAGR